MRTEARIPLPRARRAAAGLALCAVLLAVTSGQASRDLSGPPGRDLAARRDTRRKLGAERQADPVIRSDFESLLQFPHVVLVGDGYTIQCVGTIISRRAVLIPASCVAYLLYGSEVTVWEATSDPETKARTFTPFSVDRVESHPHYQLEARNDLAVIFLAQDLTGAIVEINEDPMIERSGASALAIIYSDSTTFPLTEMLNLRFVVVDKDECSAYFEEESIPYSDYIDDYDRDYTTLPAGTFCVHDYGVADVCYSDVRVFSAPVMLEGTNIQIGILARDYYCSCDSPPLVTTRLSTFKCWLEGIGVPGINSTRGPCSAAENGVDYEMPPGVIGPSREPLAPESLPTESPSPFFDDPECFPGSSHVELDNGQRVAMRDLEIGQKVRVSEDTFEPVLYFSHRMDKGSHQFVTIHLEDGSVVMATSGHLFPTSAKTFVSASNIQPGVTQLLQTDGSQTMSQTVTKVSRTVEEGLYNPHTASHMIVVDGVVASCLTTAMPMGLARLLLWPEHLAAKFGTSLYGRFLDGRSVSGKLLRLALAKISSIVR